MILFKATDLKQKLNRQIFAKLESAYEIAIEKNVEVEANLELSSVALHNRTSWSTGHDICLSNERIRVQIPGSANAFEPRMTRNPPLPTKAVDHQPAVSRSEMRC